MKSIELLLLEFKTDVTIGQLRGWNLIHPDALVGSLSVAMHEDDAFARSVCKAVTTWHDNIKEQQRNAAHTS